jgi:DNA-binding CsgD family transcriptional regulator
MLVAVYTTHLLPLVEVNDGSTALDAPTDAERQCLSLVTAGWSNLDIGERFDLSAPAVRVQIGRIRSKLGLRSMR